MYPYSVWEVREQASIGMKSCQHSFAQKAPAFLFWLRMSEGCPLNMSDGVVTTHYEIEKWEDFDTDVQITYTYLGNDGVTLRDEHLNCLIAKIEEYKGVEFTEDDLEPDMDSPGLPSSTTGVIKLGPLDIVWALTVSEEFGDELKKW